MKKTTTPSSDSVSLLHRLAFGLDLLRRDRRGAAVVVFALCLIPLCLAGGSAIDMGRAYVVKSRLGYALDAAGLAVGSATTSDPDELEAIMLAYFEANYPDYELGVTTMPTMSIVDNEVSLSATAVVNTTLMNVIGIHEMNVAAATVIIRETKGLDVVLVLDNTGSMGTTKMNSLKAASHTFLDILYGEEEDSDLLSVGVVRFSTSVNVGAGFGYLSSSYDEMDFDPFDWEGCVMARDTGNDMTDVTPTSDGTKWNAFLWPDDWSGWGSGAPATPNRYCPVELLPLIGVKSDVNDKIDERFKG